MVGRESNYTNLNVFQQRRIDLESSSDSAPEDRTDNGSVEAGSPGENANDGIPHLSARAADQTPIYPSGSTIIGAPPRESQNGLLPDLPEEQGKETPIQEIFSPMLLPPGRDSQQSSSPFVAGTLNSLSMRTHLPQPGVSVTKSPSRKRARGFPSAGRTPAESRFAPVLAFNESVMTPINQRNHFAPFSPYSPAKFPFSQSQIQLSYSSLHEQLATSPENIIPSSAPPNPVEDDRRGLTHIAPSKGHGESIRSRSTSPENLQSSPTDIRKEDSPNVETAAVDQTSPGLPSSPRIAKGNSFSRESPSGHNIKTLPAAESKTSIQQENYRGRTPRSPSPAVIGINSEEAPRHSPASQIEEPSVIPSLPNDSASSAIRQHPPPQSSSSSNQFLESPGASTSVPGLVRPAPFKKKEVKSTSSSRSMTMRSNSEIHKPGADVEVSVALKALGLSLPELSTPKAIPLEADHLHPSYLSLVRVHLSIVASLLKQADSLSFSVQREQLEEANSALLDSALNRHSIDIHELYSHLSTATMYDLLVGDIKEMLPVGITIENGAPALPIVQYLDEESIVEEQLRNVLEKESSKIFRIKRFLERSKADEEYASQLDIQIKEVEGATYLQHDVQLGEGKYAHSNINEMRAQIYNRLESMMSEKTLEGFEWTLAGMNIFLPNITLCLNTESGKILPHGEPTSRLCGYYMKQSPQDSLESAISFWQRVGAYTKMLSDFEKLGKQIFETTDGLLVVSQTLDDRIIHLNFGVFNGQPVSSLRQTGAPKDLLWPTLEDMHADLTKVMATRRKSKS